MTLHLQQLGTTYRQLLDARIEYEVILARQAADQDDEEPGKIVRAALAGADSQLAEDSDYARNTSGFHAAVGQASRNPVIALAADAIYAIWSVKVTSVLYPPQKRGEVIEQHEAIAKAIERHESALAERLMRKHMNRYRDYCEIRYPARMGDIVDWN